MTDDLRGMWDGGGASKIAVRHLLSCGTKEDFPAKEDIRTYFTAADEKLSPKIHDPVGLKPGRHVFLLCTDDSGSR